MSTGMKLLAAVVATAMIGTMGLVTGIGDEALGQHGPPPSPPVRELTVAEPVVPDDGLHRVVVTLADGIDLSARDVGPGVTVESDRRSDTEESKSAVTGLDDGAGGDWIDRVPPDATLATGGDGELGYVDREGRFHSLADSGIGSADDSEPESTDDGAAGTAEHPRDAVVETLDSIPGVESVQPISDTSYGVEASSLDGLEHLGLSISPQTFYALSADPYERYQWTLDNTGENLNDTSIPGLSQVSDADIDGVEARAGATGRGVVVAVVDSGVDLDHPELVHSAWTNPGEDCGPDGGNGVDDDGNGYVDDCTGWDFGDNDRVSFDGANNPHGTHVAGIIAARTGNDLGIAGIAPDATIMDLKVADRFGAIPSAAIARAVRYATDNGAKVVNLSLGSRPGDPPSPEVADAVAYAGSKGVLVVVAAGNDGVSLDQAPVYPASLNTDNMLVVGATGPSDQRTSFSNYGSALDMFAPGLYILSTTPGGNLEFQSGTSQASPTVAAAAALAMEALGSTDPALVIDRLTASADSLDQLTGLGANPIRLNAARAAGIAADGAGTAGSVTVRGLAADETGRVAASISIAVEDEALVQPYNWEASLYSLADGGPYAITDHTIAAGTGDEVVEKVTDGRGTVGLAPAGAMGATWSTILPGGTYALLIEAVPEGDPESRLGDGFLVTFVVPDEGPVDDGVSGGPTDPASDGGPSPDGQADDSGYPHDGSTGWDDGGSSVDDGSSGGFPGAGGTGDSGSTSGGIGGDDSDGSYQPPAQWGDGTTSGDSGGSGTGDSGRGPGATSGGTSDLGGNWGDGGNWDMGTGSGTTSGDTAGGDSSGSDDWDSEGGDGHTGSGPDAGYQPDPGADTGSNGQWVVSSIVPRTGHVDSENVVQLEGTFPEQPTVWFGDSPADTIFFAPNLIVVTTRRQATAGLVDVSLRRQSEQVLLEPDAFAFLPFDGGWPTGGAIDPDSGGYSDGGGGSTTEDSGGSTTEGSTADGSTGADGSTDDGSNLDGESSVRQPRPVANGEPVELDGGLLGVPVSGLPISGSIPVCGSAPCRASRI